MMISEKEPWSDEKAESTPVKISTDLNHYELEREESRIPRETKACLQDWLRFFETNVQQGQQEEQQLQRLYLLKNILIPSFERNYSPAQLTKIAKQFSQEVENHSDLKRIAALAGKTRNVWDQLSKSLLPTDPAYQETLFQKANWNLKSIIAEIRDEAQKKEEKDYDSNDILHLINFAHEKAFPAVEEAITRVLNGDSTEAAIAAVRSTSSAYHSAFAYATTPVYTIAPTSTAASVYAYAYAYASVYASACAYLSASVCLSTYPCASAYAYLCLVSRSSAYITHSAYTTARDYLSASAYAYASFSVLASATTATVSEFSEYLTVNEKFYESLQEDLREHKPASELEHQIFLNAISVLNNTIAFARAMKKIKTEEEKLIPPIYRDLEDSGISAFEEAQQAKTEVAWNQAKDRAIQVVARWKHEVQQKLKGKASLPCSLEEMQDQTARWEQKAFLAELHAKEESVVFKNMNVSDRFYDILEYYLNSNLKASMQRFITKNQETIGIRIAYLDHIEEQVKQLQFQEARCGPLLAGLGPKRDPMEILQTTIAFLDAISKFKREKQKEAFFSLKQEAKHLFQNGEKAHQSARSPRIYEEARQIWNEVVPLWEEAVWKLFLFIFESEWTGIAAILPSYVLSKDYFREVHLLSLLMHAESVASSLFYDAQFSSFEEDKKVIFDRAANTLKEVSDFLNKAILSDPRVQRRREVSLSAYGSLQKDLLLLINQCSSLMSWIEAKQAFYEALSASSDFLTAKTEAFEASLENKDQLWTRAKDGLENTKKLWKHAQSFEDKNIDKIFQNEWKFIQKKIESERSALEDIKVEALKKRDIYQTRLQQQALSKLSPTLSSERVPYQEAPHEGSFFLDNLVLHVGSPVLGDPVLEVGPPFLDEPVLYGGYLFLDERVFHVGSPFLEVREQLFL